MSPRPDTPTSAAAPGGPRVAPLAAQCAPVLAGGVLLAMLAVWQADRAGAAETTYLAVWICAALLPAAAMAPAPAREAALGVLLAVLTVWALPAGPARGAAVGAVLVAATASAAGRAVRSHGRSRLALTLPLALGAQALLRGELLLAPDAVDVAALVGLPAVGAAALAVLAARCGPPAALLAGAAALTLGPGWTAVTTLALAGVAAGAELRARAAGGALPAIALGVVLAAGLATETRAAAAAIAAGAIVALGRPRRFGAELTLLLAAALPAVAALVPLRTAPEAFGLLAWMPILLPALAWAPALPRSRWPPVAAALGLGLACAVAVPGPAAPAAAIAALAAVLFGDRGAEGERGRGPAGAGTTARPERRIAPAVGAAQAVWSAALLAGTALLASYPWLRPASAADALALAGLAPGWRAALALAVAAVGLGLLARTVDGAGGAGRSGGLLRRPALWAAGALLLALLAALPSQSRQGFAGPAAVLGPGRPRFVLELDGSAARTVAVSSHLSRAAALPAGTEVATLRLLDAGDSVLAARPLRAGLETGEWAARRPDVAALPALAVPPPWTVWIEAAPQAGEPFFAQLYRARWRLRPPAAATQLVIERSAALPREVMVTVHRVEVAR